MKNETIALMRSLVGCIIHKLRVDSLLTCHESRACHILGNVKFINDSLQSSDKILIANCIVKK